MQGWRVGTEAQQELPTKSTDHSWTQFHLRTGLVPWRGQESSKSLTWEQNLSVWLFELVFDHLPNVAQLSSGCEYKCVWGS